MAANIGKVFHPATQPSQNGPYGKKILPKETIHRGLKLDGAIGQGEICNSLRSKNFSKSFLSHIGKNKIKF